MTHALNTLTLRVPFTVRKRGGRKLIIRPNATEAGAIPRHRVDNSMVKALARGFRWRRLLETGVYTSIEELAAAEKINSTYVGRLLRMSLLAPKIVEAILDGRQSVDMTLDLFMRPFSACWSQQTARFVHATRKDS